MSILNLTVLTHHILDVLDIPPGHDCNVDVRHVGQPLQGMLGFQRKRGQIGMRCDWRQGTVVIQEQSQFLRVPNVSANNKRLNCKKQPSRK